MRDSDDPLSEFPSEADGAQVESLSCDRDQPDRRLSESPRTWRDHAGSIRPFVLGIIVGGLMMGYQRVIPDQRVTAFVPASEAAPARVEASPSPSADPQEDVMISTSPAQLPGATDVVSTVGRASPDGHGRPAPGPEQRGRARRPPPQPQVYVGSLLVTSTPQGAAVFINDRPVGTTPVVLADLPVGSRAVRVSLEGYDRWSRAVQVVADRQTEVNAVLTVPRPVEVEPPGSE